MDERIFIIEDDEGIRDLVKVALKAYNYEVYTFDNAEDALKAIKENKPDLCIFDIMLPGMDGISAVRYLREEPQFEFIPILMLTAKTSEVDRVVGLESGADDYLTKPFGVMELAARVKSLLRRSSRLAKHDLIAIGDISINTATMEVKKKGVPIELTLKEYELLKFIMENPERVISRDEILSSIWGFDFTGETRTLDMHVRTLRQKLGDDAEKPIYIKTVRGVGYRFVPPKV
ncbi:MAG: response regulator transcription factor [Clostridiales bacterium]|nr:response regulator transcription factor [Clostridiales bacterium]